MYAQISLVGRVTHDVELRARATTGEPYLLLGLAVNEGYQATFKSKKNITM